VVVGCVIDPEMREEIRVTVVATGIGRPVAGQQPHHQDGRRMTAIAGGRNQRVPTLDDLHVPTYIRNQRDPQSVTPRRAVGDGLSHEDTSMLDIPAFLRRQAD
jgi:cell division protein FtsZ